MSQEEIQKYADELGQQYFPNECNIWARENIEAKFVSEACVRMANRIEQELIKEACDWLNNMDNIEKCLHIRTSLVDNLAEDFCKAMEE